MYVKHRPWVTLKPETLGGPNCGPSGGPYCEESNPSGPKRPPLPPLGPHIPLGPLGPNRGPVKIFSQKHDLSFVISMQYVAKQTNLEDQSAPAVLWTQIHRVVPLGQNLEVLVAQGTWQILLKMEKFKDLNRKFSCIISAYCLGKSQMVEYSRGPPWGPKNRGPSE